MPPVRLVSLLALSACSSLGTPGKPPEVPTAPSPAVLRVVNDTAAAALFDVTFGPHQPFGIGRIGEPQDAPASLGPCLCPCGGPCPSAARPEQYTLRLEPGAAHDLAWDGLLTRSGGDLGPCCETFTPPAGRYVVTACADDGGCARVEVTLPAHEPIIVPLSARSTASGCATLDLPAHQAEVARFVTDLAPILRDRPVSDCPEARCVEPADLDGALSTARDRSCSVFVVPRGAEVETRAFLPLPPTHAGGESYAMYTDPDFTRVFRFRYEQ